LKFEIKSIQLREMTGITVKPKVNSLVSWLSSGKTKKEANIGKENIPNSNEVTLDGKGGSEERLASTEKVTPKLFLKQRELIVIEDDDEAAMCSRSFFPGAAKVHPAVTERQDRVHSTKLSSKSLTAETTKVSNVKKASEEMCKTDAQSHEQLPLNKGSTLETVLGDSFPAEFIGGESCNLDAC